MSKRSKVEQEYQGRIAAITAILTGRIEPKDYEGFEDRVGVIKTAIPMLRQGIEEYLRSVGLADQWARTAGLDRATAQFCNDMIAALTASAIATVVERTTKRPAGWRADMLGIAKAAETARDAIENLSAALSRTSVAAALRDAVGGINFDAMTSFSAPLDRLAMIADQTAAIPELIDGGGRPRYFALDMLIHGLADAYECHTGQDAKVNPNEAKPPGEKFSGPFLAFVEAVLPTAKALAGASGKPLRLPASKDALGKFVHRVTIARCPHSKPQVA